jgi:hypothetical protein
MIEQAIVRKARAVLRVQRIERATQLKYAERYAKRTGQAAGTPLATLPGAWQLHPHFDPRYCVTHARHLAKTIWRELQSEQYEPTPAVQYEIPKPDGSQRKIMAFTIPDATLSNILHRKITERNINLFSAYSFAYRPDKTVFDAILHLRRSLRAPKSYIIQYDFSKYFDRISHSYLEKILFERKLFLISNAERVAIKAFLRHTYTPFSEYDNIFKNVRDEGVPQGSSISLFLSNAAAHELDMALERQNGTFVRFADDVVAVTHSYKDALAVADQFRNHCERAGLKLNYDKSPGILLYEGGREYDVRHFTMDDGDGSDISLINHVDYLGHRIGADGVGLPDKAVRRIKRRIAEILYKHLFLHRRGTGGHFNPERIGPGFVDWDLVTAVNEVRSYIYGGLRERQLEEFLSENRKLPFVRGLMAFFPLTSDLKHLRELDGWLLSVVRRAQRERVRMLAALGHNSPVLTKAQVLDGSWYNYPEVTNDMRLPSFVRAWRVSKKYYVRYGLSGISPPSYYSLLTY